jgi:hypothetical protein
MNWFRKIKLAQQGEYWIDNSGNAIFADGDIGDFNHAGYVIQTIFDRYDVDPNKKIEQTIDLWVDDLRNPQDEDIKKTKGSKGNELWVKNVNDAIEILSSGKVKSVSLDNDLGEQSAGEGYQIANWIEEQAFNGLIPPMACKVHSDNAARVPAIIQALKNAIRYWDRFPSEYYQYNIIKLREAGATQEEIDVILDKIDPRTFAIQNWGWKRILNNNIETFHLTKRDLTCIANGLFDILDETVNDKEFNIFVVSNQTWYVDVPWEVFDKENINEIQRFKRI